VIVHLLLFRPRASLTAEERSALLDSFATAVREIPFVRRAQVGRRVTHGRPYEQMMRSDYPYAALLEFDDVAALKAYFEHPAHEQLASRFFAAAEELLIYDYEL
jgi:Stress responsive A/B Barrel Domain